jgi:hypothetical protein
MDIFRVRNHLVWLHWSSQAERTSLETEVVPRLVKASNWQGSRRGSRYKTADCLSLSCLYLPLTLMRANPKRASKYNRKHLAGILNAGTRAQHFLAAAVLCR